MIIRTTQSINTRALTRELQFQHHKGYWPKSIGNRASKYYRLVDPGSIVQGSHRRVVDRGGCDEKRAHGLPRILAKLSVDRSVELAADVPFLASFFFK